MVEIHAPTNLLIVRIISFLWHEYHTELHHRSLQNLLLRVHGSIVPRCNTQLRSRCCVCNTRMGDCRIKIVVSRVANANNVTIVKQFSSDATIREVRDDILHSLSEQHSISVWDCTTHPPRDISRWLFVEFTEPTGPKSKTLFDAGCFPSAVWQVLPHDAQPLTRSVMEDSQYNHSGNNESSSPPFSKVEQVGLDSDLKPSQVLGSVANRFSNAVDDTEGAIRARRQMLLERRAKEADRHLKLEERIQTLKSINSGTSIMVQTMLLKSRCTGDKRLEMQDRVYLHVALVNGETVTEHFHYFSRQDAVARVVQRFAPKLPQEAEFLISVADHSYRRLPTSLRLYKAIETGLLKEADSVIIRCFSPPDEDQSTSALEDEHHVIDGPETMATHFSHQEEPPSALPASIPSSTILDISQDLTDLLNCAVAELDKKSKSKKSSSAAKVREMTMKSKATGDAKRTPKMEHRFFLELVVLENGSVSTTFVYMGRKDTIDRLMTEHAKGGNKAFAVTDEGSFVSLAMENRFEDLEARHVLRCFDRILVVVHG